MCYVGCRYESESGGNCGECTIADDERIPRDAICKVDDLEDECRRVRSENERLSRTMRNLVQIIRKAGIEL